MTHTTPWVALLAALTAGIVIGVSFIAQPVKFSASDVALAQQVRIGSVIFHASHKVQAVMLLSLAGAMVLARPQPGWAWAAAAAAAAALLAQALLLMPRLDARVVALTSGQVPAPEPALHVLYVVLEVAKLLLLAGLAWLALRAASQAS